MRLSLLAVALLVLIGCDRSDPQQRRGTATPPNIPASADISSIHLVSHGSSLGPAYDVTLTRRPDIDAMVAWLKGIDWSPARANDLSNAGLASVGTITLRKADGNTESLGLSGGSVILNRREWPADTDRLASIAEQAGGKR